MSVQPKKSLKTNLNVDRRSVSAAPSPNTRSQSRKSIAATKTIEIPTVESPRSNRKSKSSAVTRKVSH